MSGVRLRRADWQRDAAALSQVRRAVFIDEQGVPEALEWDAADATALHWLAITADGTPVGCARLLADGQIGRMAVLAGWRGQGIGSALLAAALEAARSPEHRHAWLSAQLHATGFYARAGFVAEGPVYLEAGIPHVAMRQNFD